MAGAATGTGKTAAFVLPLLQQLIDEPNRSQQAKILMMAPTRELAFQIQHVVKQLAKKPLLQVVFLQQNKLNFCLKNVTSSSQHQVAY